ncbi:hypothetical protein KY290_007248 [Solanum tuberosum]|uniref:NB-ARC domain-containing protein n=1 Tax=Solanum tuberosum TaxID=4113 RepID=A0ABQ7W506_SOLTU|nr:hypothetical protein KY290_007248 [Solanum tuberosum]
MAYAALSSLMHTLDQLLKPNQSFVCLSSTQKHVRSLYQNLSVLQVFLDDATKETKDIETLKFIEKRIRDVIYKAEDKVDSSLRNIILADCTEKREGAAKFFEEELLKVEKDVDSPRKEVMVVECNKHGSKSAELASISSSLKKSTIEENTIVGMEDDFNIILDRLTSQKEELTVIPIFGMGGIGKTTLARKVYDNSCIRSRFDKQAWVTISEKFNERQMLLELVSSITGSKQETSDDELMEIVYRGLKRRRFLIVIDDIWSTEAWDQMQRIFPNDDNKSRILLTTRLKYVADYVSCPYFPPHSKSFLSLEDSWNLFTEKLFKKDHCPPLLEEIGKHIVQQCRGLPLSVVVVAGLVGKMDPTYDNWKNVEENLNSFFGTVSERCQSILSLSYNYLPQYLKACFLYVGVFPEDREINVSKLIKLWIAEQFVKEMKDKRLEVVAEEYVEELIDRSLILAGKQRANGRTRTCKIHDLLRQLCLSKAHTENVVHVMNGNVLEAIDDQRRVILLSKYEEKYDYHPRHSSGIVRTFISMGVAFPKEMSSSISEFKLLKVLDALSIKTDFSGDLETLHIKWTIFCGDNFRPNLKQLKLTCTRIPWEDVKLLANLPNLEVLKGDRAFDGTYWKLDEDIVFHKLKYLLLNGCYHLERWDLAAGSDNFPVLEQLMLDSLYTLEEIPESIGDIMTLKFIGINWCGSGVHTSAKKIQQEQQSLGNYELQLQISPMMKREEWHLQEAGDDYILPHLLNFWDKKPLQNRETVKVPLVGRMIEVS